MPQLNWIKCAGGNWCSFREVDLGNGHFDGLEGVYIIWQSDGPVVRVGQGVIRDRISVHREDPAITNYGNLSVTWAKVASQDRDGIERYLAETLSPEVGSAFPQTQPMAVNLPWPWRGR